jgi:signal transduction histidine kinase
VPVETLLRELERLVRPLAVPLGIAVEFSCEPETPAIKGDPVLLLQALLNLGLNSIDAIGGRMDGRIGIRAGVAEPGRVEIHFLDNGGGVPPGKCASLFEPFFTTKPTGLGMGLPLVRSIIEEHGGGMDLDNRPGQGLEVRLRLPASQP